MPAARAGSAAAPSSSDLTTAGANLIVKRFDLSGPVRPGARQCAPVFSPNQQRERFGALLGVPAWAAANRIAGVSGCAATQASSIASRKQRRKISHSILEDGPECELSPLVLSDGHAAPNRAAYARVAGENSGWPSAPPCTIVALRRLLGHMVGPVRRSSSSSCRLSSVAESQPGPARATIRARADWPALPVQVASVVLDASSSLRWVNSRSSGGCCGGAHSSPRTCCCRDRPLQVVEPDHERVDRSAHAREQLPQCPKCPLPQLLDIRARRPNARGAAAMAPHSRQHRKQLRQ